MKIVTVRKTGRRYIYAGERWEKVTVRGEIRRRNGLALVHGTDKVFRRNDVWITDESLTEELVQKLCEQSPELEPTPPPPPEPPPGPPKWVEWHRDCVDGRNRAQLTEHACRELEAMGKSSGPDLVAGGMDESILGDAAMDSAAYLDELTREGVREGYMVPVREAAADLIYEGMLKGVEEYRKEKGVQ